MDVNLQVSIGNLTLKNPVMTASGTFGYASEFSSLLNLHRLGAIIVKGISLEPRPGNPPPRIVETAGGMLNAIGLENVGFDRFVEEKMPFLRDCRSPIIVNILGNTIDDYRELAAKLSEVEGVDGLEVNISCPNVKHGGVAFGTNAEMAGAVTAAVRETTDLPVIVKLSPNVTDVAAIAKTVEDNGADAVSLINTLMGMAIDIQARKPVLANVIGGLSGPAIKPVALRMVYQTAQAVSIPIIGIGGISTAEDAIEFLLAGATGIQVGTANFINPRAGEEIIDGIATYLEKHSIATAQQLIGSLQV